MSDIPRVIVQLHSAFIQARIAKESLESILKIILELKEDVVAFDIFGSDQELQLNLLRDEVGKICVIKNPLGEIYE